MKGRGRLSHPSPLQHNLCVHCVYNADAVFIERSVLVIQNVVEYKNEDR